MIIDLAGNTIRSQIHDVYGNWNFGNPVLTSRHNLHSNLIPSQLSDYKRAIFRWISRGVYSGGFGQDKRKRRPEGWITSVECLQAPSDWCSRLGAGPGAGAPAAVVPTPVPGKIAVSGVAGPAPARRDCAITTAGMNSTRSR